MSRNSLSAAPLFLEQVFSVGPGKVFDAWINPDLISRWLFKSDDNLILQVDIDLRPGGAFSILEKTAAGEMIDHFGRYLLIDPPHELQFTLEVPMHFSGVTTVQILINSIPGGTNLQFRQRGVDPAVVEDAWKKMFRRLSKIMGA